MDIPLHAVKPDDTHLPLHDRIAVLNRRRELILHSFPVIRVNEIHTGSARHIVFACAAMQFIKKIIPVNESQLIVKQKRAHALKTCRPVQLQLISLIFAKITDHIIILWGQMLCI